MSIDRTTVLDPSAPPAETTAAVAAEAARPTILLVEDEESLRRLAADFARSFGLHVLDAAGSRQALEICAAHAGAIDLLVTDVAMPDGNGLELADEVCRCRPGTRVLFMTGDSQAWAVEARVRAGRGSVLAKPFSLAGLIRALEDALPLRCERQLATGGSR